MALISRDDRFIIPNGSTVIEGGDVLLVLSDKAGIRKVEAAVNVIRPREEIEKQEQAELLEQQEQAQAENEQREETGKKEEA